MIRSLTKHWSIPGVRAGYALGPAPVIAELRAQQSPWSVSATAAAAIRACSTEAAMAESERRALTIIEWRRVLTEGLDELGSAMSLHAPRSSWPGSVAGVQEALRRTGIGVRRADTFPGLDDSWARIAVRPPELSHQLLNALKSCRSTLSADPTDALG